MVLVRLLLTVMVALSVRVQFAAEARLPPLKVNVLVSGTPVKVPPQVPTLKLGGLAMIIPAGMVSVKEMPLKGVFWGLFKRTLKMEEDPPNTESGLKPLTTPMLMEAMVSRAVAGDWGLIVVGVP